MVMSVSLFLPGPQVSMHIHQDLMLFCVFGLSSLAEGFPRKRYVSHVITLCKAHILHVFTLIYNMVIEIQQFNGIFKKQGLNVSLDRPNLVLQLLPFLDK